MKVDYSTSDSDADMRAVYCYMYGSEEEVGEPAGEGDKAHETASKLM